MSDTAVWPYDAAERDPLTALRIPVTGPSPQWYYTVALDVSDVPYIQGAALRPDGHETVQLASFLEFQLSTLSAGYRAKLRERPFDIGVNNATRVFRKWAPGDWSYRLSSWEAGPFYSPPGPGLRETDVRLSLVRVLDRAEYSDGRNGSPNLRWLEWKAARPGVFGDV